MKLKMMALATLLGWAGISCTNAQTSPEIHGAVRVVYYYSPLYHSQRRMHVYLPPGYFNGRGAYPVLYLTHGQGEDDSSWIDKVHVPDILDHLIDSGKAMPMIVVMPTTGGADSRLTLPIKGVDPTKLMSVKLSPEQLAARANNAVEARDAFLSDLTQTLIPFIQAHYRVPDDRNSRAIAGSSYGGSEAIFAAARHRDEFAWFGVFGMGIQGGSSALPNPISGSGSPETPAEFVAGNHDLFADPAKINANIRLFFIGVGTHDIIVRDGPQHLSQTLTAHGITNHFETVDGGHGPMSWAPLLTDYFQLLFR